MKEQLQSIKLLSLLLGLLPFVVAHSQVKMTHTNQLLYVSPGTQMFVNGSVETTAPQNANAIMGNDGTITITDSLINNGGNRIFGSNLQINGSKGKLIFKGTSAQFIVGLDTINLKQVEINNTAGVTLSKTINVDSNFTFTQGNVFLDTSDINLGKDGNFISENNGNRVIGYPGAVTLEKAFSSGTNTDISGTGIQAGFTGNSGSIKIVRIHFPQAAPANGSINRFYEVIPTNSGGSIHSPGSEYFDANDLANHDEDSLNVYISSDGGSVWRDKQGTRDGSNDNVLVNSTSVTWQLDNNINNKTIITLADDSCHVLPYVDIIEDTIPICSGGSTWIVADGVVGMERIWSNGLSNVDSIQVSTVGKYIITIINEKGCVNTDSVVVINSLDPVANFTVAQPSVCLGDTISFTDASTSPNGNHTYSWSFGDSFNVGNDTSTLASPSYGYIQQGGFITTLTVTSDIGCVHSKTQSITVLPIPQVSFNVPNVCNSSVVNFDNTTTLQNQSGISYDWTFGDGTTFSNTGSSTGSSGVYTTNNTATNHTYSANGTYNVKLIASAGGCKDSIVQPVSIYPNPTASFTSTSACPNETITFTNNSSISSGNLSYQWFFGNGQNSSVTNPTQPYLNSGTYTASLVVTSDQGCKDSIGQLVTVHTIPTPSFSFSNACEGKLTNFSNTTTDVANSTYNWNFGDGNNASTVNAINTFNNEGTYNVKLIATSINGCIDSIAQNIISFPNPVANFSVTNGCEQSVISFANTSSVTSGSLTYNWDFNNGNLSNQTNVQQVYSIAGAKNVKLIATSNNGCLDSIIKPLQIYPLPILNIGNNITTCGSSYVLDAQNTGSSYFWSNGQTTQTISANNTGYYNVTVISTNNCVQKDTVSITLNSAVIVNLGPDASFCDSVTLNADYPNSTFTWNTGANSQMITPTTSGNYSVSVTDQNNCVGTDDINVTINSSPIVNLGGNQQSCVGVPVTLDAGTHTGYLWNDNSTNQTLIVNNTGTYVVEVENIFSCKTKDSALVTFNPLPVVNLGPDAPFCDSVMLDAANIGVTYVWSTGATDSSIVVTTSGNYSCTATIGNTGCSSSDDVNITINTSPSIELGNDSTLCSYNSINLDATITSGTYVWNNGATSPQINVSSTGLYRVLVTDANSCSTSDSINIVVNPILVENLGNDFTLCKDAEARLNSSVSNATYTWENAVGILGTNSFLEIDTAGTYWVSIIDPFGCETSDTVIVIPSLSSITAQFLAQSTVLIGDSLSFINLSFPQPYDSYWEMGDGLVLTDSMPTYVYNIPGDYEVLLAVTNTQCSDTMRKTITVEPLKILQEESDLDAGLYNGIVNAVLYPNPNNGEFSVKIELEKEGVVGVQVFNITGQLLLSDNIRGKGKEIIEQYDFTALKPGLYLFRIQLGKQVKVLKFVKI
jgi:PKD repeat protein